jgi:hypothetical protein
VIATVYRVLFRSVEFPDNRGLTSSSLLHTPNINTINAASTYPDPLRDTLDTTTGRIQIIPSFETQTDPVETIATNPIERIDILDTPTKPLEPVFIDGLKFYPTDTLFTPSNIWADSKIPGMFSWIGEQKILKELWLASLPLEIRKDNNNTHIINLGTAVNITTIESAISAVWGNSLAITSENIINNNWLIWNPIYTLELPKYKSTKYMRLLKYQERRRRVIIDQSVHKVDPQVVKNYIASY